MAFQPKFSALYWVQMHYNLHVRTKPKRHIPYKKVVVVVAIAVALIATYFVAVRQTANYQKPPVKAQTPA